MACAQALASNRLALKQTSQPQIARRHSQRPFTTVAAGERRQTVCKANASPISQILTASAAAAMLLAQPAFANVNIISDVSESSGPVEKLKGKFAGPQDAQEQRAALDSFQGQNTTGGFDERGIGRQEDATIDNPNDSPRPKDRSRMGSSDAKKENLNKFAQTQQSSGEVDVQNTK